jgi:VWFA-related protein
MTMRTHFYLSIFCFALACLPLLFFPQFCAVAGAQQASSPSLQTRREPPPSRTIQLNVIVTPKSGAPVAGLQEKDFTVLDNKVPQTITSFRAYNGSQEPIEVILLIDSINIGIDVVAIERIQIDKFLHSNDGRLTHPTTLAVLTNRDVQMQGAYTLDGNRLANSLDKYTIGLRTIGRSAGVEGDIERFDDSMNALRELATYESTRPGRKIILWISPGWPLLSGPGFNLTSKQEQGIFEEITSLTTQLRQSQTTIYSVNPLGANESVSEASYYEEFLKGVTKPQEASFGNLGVQVIATETGGLVLSSNDIAGLLARCVADTGAYYKMSFEPPPAEPRDVYHHLEVTLAKPGLIARTTTGYYAEP